MREKRRTRERNSGIRTSPIDEKASAVQELLIPLVIGGTVALVGCVMLWGHVANWREQQADRELEADELEHYRKQFRRRMQTSGMIVLLGIMLCLATEKIPWQRAPGMFSIYVILLLGLVCWVVLLALGDFASNRAFGRVALGRIRRKQEALEVELEQIRRRGPNGDGEQVVGRS